MASPLLPWRSALGIALGACIAATTLAPHAARAVSPEYFYGIALHPSDPEVFALRYESGFGGLVFSRDGGRSAQLVPGFAVHDYGLRGRTPMTFLRDGKLLLALDSGLDIDDGKGCFPPPPGGGEHFSELAVKGLYVNDVVVHPSDQDISFLVTRASDQPGHAGLWKRDKQGTLTPIGASEPVAASLNEVAFVVTDLSVIARSASSEGVRFLLAGLQRDSATTPATSKPVLRVSDDLGMTWTTHPLPHTGDGNLRILLADASEPFKALLAFDNPARVDMDPIDPLFVTRNGGQSFEAYLDKVEGARDAVLLPSGQLLIGDHGANGGLWSATSFDATPTRIDDQTVACLAYQPSTQKVLMCRLYELGEFDLASGSFCTMFRLRDASAFPSCPEAPLNQYRRATDQLCDNFCGLKHYASSPLCGAFPIAPGRLCGPAAFADDTADPDPDKHWLEPPGRNAAPRCAGFAVPDAGVGGAADASVEPDAGADAGALPADVDAAFGGKDGGLPSDAPEVNTPPGEDEVKLRSKDGCGCRLADGATRTGAAEAWAGAAIAALLGVTSRRRIPRRAMRRPILPR